MFVLVQYARFNNTVKMSVGRMCSNVCSECAVCVHLITSCTTWGFIPACLIHISGNMWHLGMHRCVSQRCTPSCSKTKKFNKGLRMSQCAQGKHRFRQRIYLLFILSCFWKETFFIFLPLLGSDMKACVHLIKLTFTFRSWSRRMFSSLRSRCTTPLCKESRGTWVYRQIFYLCMQAHHCRVWSLQYKPNLRCSVCFSVFLFIILRPLTFHSGLVLQGRVSNIPLNLEKGSRCLIDRREEVLCLG